MLHVLYVLSMSNGSGVACVATPSWLAGDWYDIGRLSLFVWGRHASFIPSCTAFHIFRHARMHSTRIQCVLILSFAHVILVRYVRLVLLLAIGYIFVSPVPCLAYSCWYLCFVWNGHVMSPLLLPSPLVFLLWLACPNHSSFISNISFSSCVLSARHIYRCPALSGVVHRWLPALHLRLFCNK